MPGGLAPRGQAEFTTRYEEWQQGQIKANQDLTKATADQAAAADAAAKATKTRDDLIAKADTPEKRAAMADELAKATKEYSDKNKALGEANDKLIDATNRQTIEAGKPPPKPPGKEELTPDKNAERLGQGLVKGIFQELGFPDVFGKDPTQWGITKLAMGGLGWGLNTLNQMAEAQGGATVGGGAVMAPAGQSGLMGLFKSLIPGAAIKETAPGVAGYLPQIPGMPGPPQVTVGPAAAHSDIPPQPGPAGADAAASAGLGGTLNVTNNNSGIMSQKEANQTIKDAAWTTPAAQIGAPVDVLH
jgi:hypothetical protein